MAFNLPKKVTIGRSAPGFEKQATGGGKAKHISPIPFGPPPVSSVKEQFQVSLIKNLSRG